MICQANLRHLWINGWNWVYKPDQCKHRPLVNLTIRCLEGNTSSSCLLKGTPDLRPNDVLPGAYLTGSQKP